MTSIDLTQPTSSGVAQVAFAVGAALVLVGHPVSVTAPISSVTLTTYSFVGFAGLAVLAVGAAAWASVSVGRSRLAAATGAILLGLAAVMPVALTALPEGGPSVDAWGPLGVFLGHILAGAAMLALAVAATSTRTRTVLVASAIATIVLIAIMGPNPGPTILVELASLVFAAGPLALALELGDMRTLALGPSGP